MEKTSGKLGEKIKLLIELQAKDTIIYQYAKKIENFPGTIDELKNILGNAHLELEESKKNITKLQLAKKEKEIELETREAEIKKHSNELNAVKTNEAYRASISEIEKAKQQKLSTENEIIELMEKIEFESNNIKNGEKEFKQKESNIETDIKKIEGDLLKLKEEIAGLEAERNEFAKQLDNEVLKNYEYIRDARSGLGIVPMHGENCSGCHFTLRPQVIVEVHKEQDLVFCDSCSRILYRPPETSDK